jgi:hypothetical protein
VIATAQATKTGGISAACKRPCRTSAAASASAKSALDPASSATLMMGPAASRKRPSMNEAAAIMRGMPCG